MARDEDANSFQSGVRSRESDSSHPQDLGRPTFVFPPPEVKFDGGNMFEWSKMINLTLHGCQLGDYLTENPREETNPEYKKLKAEESLILSWMLRSMTPEMRRDFVTHPANKKWKGICYSRHSKKGAVIDSSGGKLTPTNPRN